MRIKQPDTLHAADRLGRRDFLGRLLLSAGALAAGQQAAASLAGQRGAAAARSHNVEDSAPLRTVVLVNQVGFLPDEGKRGVVAASAPVSDLQFTVIDDSPVPREIHRGLLQPYVPLHDDEVGLYSWHGIADFDALRRPGRYRIRLADGALSCPFDVGRSVYEPIVPLTLRFFAIQRCGATCEGFHEACHTDDGRFDAGALDGDTRDTAGGWHDAGDYLKFAETCTYVAAMLLKSLDLFPHLARLSGAAGEPLLLEHGRVGLDWLLRMHPGPETFFYQVGDESDHDSWRLPEEDCAARDPRWKPRAIFPGVGANLAGRATAALALGARLYERHDRPYAQRCLQAARSAFELGIQHPSVQSTAPEDFYPESTWQDDMAWGGAELYRATKEEGYLHRALDFAWEAGAAGEPLSVYNTHALAHSTLYPLVEEADRQELDRYLKHDADEIRLRTDNPFGLGVRYQWGTAGVAAGAALSCLLYARSTEQDASLYEEIARRNRDFILGCNPFNTSMLIGAGARYPLYPHHQIANIRQVELTGALVGGPAPARTIRSQHIDLHRPGRSMVSSPPIAADRPGQKVVYHDIVQDYVTNEPAIDYTVAFLMLSAFYHQPS